ncbi:AP2/ERF family transcription factor [Kaarinaea lacus]
MAKKTKSPQPKTARASSKSNGLGLTYITRMDHGNTHGWWVRVYKDSRPVDSRLFSDGVYGGKDIAKKNAQEHRDRVVKKHKIVPVHMRKTREHTVDSRNTSGIVGVTLSVAKKSGNLRVHWSARFMENGRQKNVSFSVRKYGYQDAFKQALKARCQAIGQNVPRGVIPPEPDRGLKKWMRSVGI